jgi:hypothetical protein
MPPDIDNAVFNQCSFTDVGRDVNNYTMSNAEIGERPLKPEPVLGSSLSRQVSIDLQMRSVRMHSMTLVRVIHLQNAIQTPERQYNPILIAGGKDALVRQRVFSG